MKMNVHFKVQQARLNAGMNQTAFAKKLGLSQNDVWRMENGEKKFVSRAYIDFMLEQGYDLNSLFDNNLELQKNMREITHEPNVDNHLKYSEIEKENYIPLFPDSFMNNFTYFLNNQDEITPIDYLYIPYSLQNLFQSEGALRVRGDSMYPILKPNDVIIFNKHPIKNEDILFGEIYLISLKLGQQEIVSLSRLQHAEYDEESIKLVFDNPRYQSKDISIEKINAMALVKASIVINSTISWKHN